MRINAQDMHFKTLNEQVRACEGKEIIIDHCMGQRYIGSGLTNKHITVYGTPGNALGAYLDGAEIKVMGNTQEATGDTMNEGSIVVHGSCGDATGYAMRGGTIYVEGNAGYRAGIHMKAYKGKLPVLVIGGCAGSFLGEYQAGGLILVLGLHPRKNQPLVGNFCAAGMHGGKIVLRGKAPKDLSPQVLSEPAAEEDMKQIEPYLEAYCMHFGASLKTLLAGPYTVLKPDTKNPYKQLYTHH